MIALKRPLLRILMFTLLGACPFLLSAQNIEIQSDDDKPIEERLVYTRQNTFKVAIHRIQYRENQDHQSDNELGCRSCFATFAQGNQDHNHLAIQHAAFRLRQAEPCLCPSFRLWRKPTHFRETLLGRHRNALELWIGSIVGLAQALLLLCGHIPTLFFWRIHRKNRRTNLPIGHRHPQQGTVHQRYCRNQVFSRRTRLGRPQFRIRQVANTS